MQSSSHKEGSFIIPPKIPANRAAKTKENKIENTTLTGHYNGADYRIERTPIQSNSLHIEYDYCYLQPKDCVDISTENDSFYCYPQTKENVVTKLAFATEILYQKQLEAKKRK